MTAPSDRADRGARDLARDAEDIREAPDFESMRGLLGELPPGIFPPRSEWRRHRER